MDSGPPDRGNLHISRLPGGKIHETMLVPGGAHLDDLFVVCLFCSGCEQPQRLRRLEALLLHEQLLGGQWH